MTRAVTLLEDSPHFNAGRGAVFNAEGKNELDASIMEGANLNAGAVAAVHNVRNPVLLARKVMTDSAHVMLMGEGAEAFAREQGIAFEDDAYFHTDYRWQQLQKAKASNRPGCDLPVGNARPRGSRPLARWRWTVTATSPQALRPAA